MDKYIKKLKNQLENSSLIPVFEIEVTNKESGQAAWIVFDISIEKNSIIARHEALTTKQQKSKKVSFVSVKVDSFFTLDEHLELLYDACLLAICESDFFTLNIQ